MVKIHRSFKSGDYSPSLGELVRKYQNSDAVVSVFDTTGRPDGYYSFRKINGVNTDECGPLNFPDFEAEREKLKRKIEHNEAEIEKSKKAIAKYREACNFSKAETRSRIMKQFQGDMEAWKIDYAASFEEERELLRDETEKFQNRLKSIEFEKKEITADLAKISARLKELEAVKK